MGALEEDEELVKDREQQMLAGEIRLEKIVGGAREKRQTGGARRGPRIQL